MKNVSMRKLSILGLVLLAASAVTAAVLPKDESKKFVGAQAPTTSPTQDDQLTCLAGGAGEACEYTANSGTSVGDNSSGGTTTGGTLNSSISPN